MSEIQTGFQFIELTWEQGISWDVLWIDTPTPQYRIGESTFLGQFASRALADTFVNALRMQGFDGTVDYRADQALGRHDPVWAACVAQNEADEAAYHAQQMDDEDDEAAYHALTGE